MTNPLANAGQFAAEDDVIALWREPQVLAARQLVGRMWKNGWGDLPPAEVLPLIEGHIDEYLTNWLFKAAASDAQHPRFVRNFAPAHRWHGRDVPGARTGGDNPDNIYRLAGIAHGSRYRVNGRAVGQPPANVSFTLVGNWGTSVTIQTLEDHQLARDPDGAFVITIDGEPANGRPNHLTTAPHVKFLFVRDSLGDWARETPLALDIERIGEPARAPLSLTEMAERAAFRAREDVPLYHWFQSAWTSLQPGGMSPAETLRGLGGLVTQGLAKGHFRIAEDEAVVIDYEPAGAAYVSIQLSDWLYRSLDADRLQSSLTRAQSHIGADGRVRAVIARTDPGVANWLDCGGFETVLVLHRWQGLPEAPVRGGPQVRAQLVKLAGLREVLPPDTAGFGPSDRAAQLAGRRAAYARRF